MSNDHTTPEFWEANYRQGQRRWELGGATPVFRRLAESGEFAPGRMIIPGAGLGDDGRLFARHGFQVTAVDFAPTAARAMHARQDPAEPLVILQADWFDLPPRLNGVFDYVLEYVFIAAIDPAQRAAFADVVAALLRPGGTFIGLLWPIGTHSSGPPFAVHPADRGDRGVGAGPVGRGAVGLEPQLRPGRGAAAVQPDDVIALLADRGLSLLRRERPPDSVPWRQGKEELVVMARGNYPSASPTTISRSLSSSKREPS